MSNTKQIVNVLYYKQRKNFDDKVMIVYKDFETNEKKFEIVETPEIEFYINKDEYFTDQQVNFIEMDKVDKFRFPVKNLLKEIAYQLGNDAVNFWKECISSRNFYATKRLHLNANVHGSDIDPADFYIGEFINLNKQPETAKISKGYFDIEVDLNDYNGFPNEHEAPCPLNVATYFHEDTMTAYVVIYHDPRNDSIAEFREDIDGFIKEAKEWLSEEDNITGINIKINVFDSEIEAIIALFNIINSLKADFIGAWNNQFDILTLINRIKQAGYDETEIICPKEMPYKQVYYNEDTRNQSYGDNGSYFDITSWGYWIDLMKLYANIRKSNKKDSYSLNAIAEEELNKKKLEFGPGETMKNLPWINFKKFVKYNIRDVILLYLLEKKTNDLNLLYCLSIMTRTRLSKTLKKTVCLKNLANYFFKQQGYVMSNNHNSTYGGEKISYGKFRGAYVADPSLNANNGLKINGRLSKYLHENIIDMDLSSLYPSIILTYNMDASTQLGKAYLLKETSNGEFVDKAPDFIDALSSGDTLTMCNTYFNMATPEEMIEIINKK